MTIAFTTTFTRLGKLVGALNEADTFRGTTLVNRADTIDNQYETTDQSLMEGLYPALAGAISAQDSYINYLSTLAQNTVIRAVTDDRPAVSASIGPCMIELDRQMRIGAQSLKRYVSAVAVTPTLTAGDMVISATTLNGLGLASSITMPDVWIITPTSVSHTSPLTVVGTASRSLTAYNYPGGSGISGILNPVDPAADGTLLANGSFNLFSAPPIPDGWTIVAGPTWTQVSDDPRGGTHSALQAAVVAGTIVVYQTVATLQPYTRYAWTLKYKPTVGTGYNLSASLTDSAGTVLVSPAGVNQTTATAVASIGSSWRQLSGFFVTPANVPVTAQFRITVDSTTATVRFAHAGLISATPLTPSGTTLVAWSGTIPAAPVDFWSVATTLAASSSTSLLRGVNRLLNLNNILPNELPTVTGGAETQADALVS